MNQSQIASFIWGVADLIRDTFKRGKYQDVILPLTVLRRLDCVLADKKEKVLARQAELRGKDGHPEPDPDLRDTESVPLAESIEEFFEREVEPHVPDAWIDTARCDPKDGEVGIVGYEINFNRYFYEYTPPRPLEKIAADIQAIERDIVSMLREVAG
jgi:type I restriction enzyme M protein